MFPFDPLTLQMAVRRGSGGLCLLSGLAWAASMTLYSVAAAQGSGPMELSSQSVAETPAAAEAPSDGQGPSIKEQVLL